MNKIKAEIYPLEEPKGNLLAYASVAINDAMVVKGLKVMDSEDGLFVGMPSKKVDGEYQNTFHAVTKDAHKELSEAVLAAYDDKLRGLRTEIFDLNPEKVTFSARAYPIENPENNLIARADIAMNKAFVFKDLKLIDGDKGLFVSMPASKDVLGEYHDNVYPLTKDAQAAVKDAVVAAYDKAVDKKPSIKQQMETAAKSAAAYQASRPEQEKTARAADAR